MPSLDDPRHEKFALAVADGYSQQRAFHLAGYGPSSNDYLLLAKRPEVIARVRELFEAKLALAGVTADRTKHELARIAYVDVRRLFDENGDLLPVHKLDDDTAAAISSIKVETQYRGKGDAAVPVTVLNYKFAPKMDALGLLAKHFKIVGDADDEGVNNLANALAGRLNAAQRRTGQPIEDIEDATIIEPEEPPALPPPADEDLW